MIAVDTNILVYAHRHDSEFFHAASSCIGQLAQGGALWAIPWPCVHEFLAVVTNPQAINPPTPMDRAIDQFDAWRESPTLRFLAEPPGYWESLSGMLKAGKVTGPKIHDARIAAICKAHGVRELWTADRDFSRISGLRTRNPLLTN